MGNIRPWVYWTFQCGEKTVCLHCCNTPIDLFVSGVAEQGSTAVDRESERDDADINPLSAELVSALLDAAKNTFCVTSAPVSPCKKIKQPGCGDDCVAKHHKYLRTGAKNECVIITPERHVSLSRQKDSICFLMPAHLIDTRYTDIF